MVLRDVAPDPGIPCPLISAQCASCAALASELPTTNLQDKSHQCVQNPSVCFLRCYGISVVHHKHAQGPIIRRFTHSMHSMPVALLRPPSCPPHRWTRALHQKVHAISAKHARCAACTRGLSCSSDGLSAAHRKHAPGQSQQQGNKASASERSHLCMHALCHSCEHISALGLLGTYPTTYASEADASGFCTTTMFTLVWAPAHTDQRSVSEDTPGDRSRSHSGWPRCLHT